MGKHFCGGPSALKEALTLFTQIREPIYANKSLGSSGQLEIMPCECSQQAFLPTRRRANQQQPTKHQPEANNEEFCGPNSNCINRLTYMECFGEQCGCTSEGGSGCANQRFQRQQYASIDVFHAGKKGYGVRAKEKIPKGTFIYEYTGEVLDEARFVRRQQKYEREGVKHFYFMMLQKEEYIDATEKGSIARFCNHSCNPNAVIEKWVVGPKLRMGLFAKRDIAAGEEICFDYKVDRYGSKAQPCYCNEPNCSGFLGGRTQTGGGPLPPAVIEGLGLDSATHAAWPERALRRLREREIDLESVLNEQRAAQRAKGSDQEDPNVPEDPKDPKDPKDQKPNESNEPRNPKDPKDTKELKEPNESNEPRSPKELKDLEKLKQPQLKEPQLKEPQLKEQPELKEELKPQLKENPKQELKENLKENPKPQLKEELKELNPQLNPTKAEVNPTKEVKKEIANEPLELKSGDSKLSSETSPNQNFKRPATADEAALANLPTHIPLPVRPLTESELHELPPVSQKSPPKPPKPPEQAPFVPPPSGNLAARRAPLEPHQLPPVVQPPSSQPPSQAAKRARKKNLIGDLLALLDCTPLTKNAELARKELMLSFPINPLTTEELPEFMRILMQRQEGAWVISLMLQRILASDSQTIQFEILNMHGYQIMGTVLNRWVRSVEVVKLGLEVLKRWPRVTKNKISSSQIEPVVDSISRANLSSEVTSLASALLEEWKGLSMGYRIPKRREAKPDAPKHDHQDPVKESPVREDPTREDPTRDETAKHESVKEIVTELVREHVKQHARDHAKEEPIKADYRQFNYFAQDERKEDREERLKEERRRQERQRQQDEIQRIIAEAAAAPKEKAKKEPEPHSPQRSPDSSWNFESPFYRRAVHVETALASYVPKLVFINEPDLGRDRCRRHSRNIVHSLCRKELARNSESTEFELTRERKNKIKGFVKEYMKKVLVRARKEDREKLPPSKRAHLA